MFSLFMKSTLILANFKVKSSKLKSKIELKKSMYVKECSKASIEKWSIMFDAQNKTISTLLVIEKRIKGIRSQFAAKQGIFNDFKI